MDCGRKVIQFLLCCFILVVETNIATTSSVNFDSCVALPKEESEFHSSVLRKLDLFLEKKKQDGHHKTLAEVLNNIGEEKIPEEIAVDTEAPFETSLLQLQSLLHQKMVEEVDKRFQDIKRLLKPPSDCMDLLLDGNSASGVYKIYPQRSPWSSPVSVVCDMETDGGGWTVFLSRMRQDKQQGFSKDWKKYKYGFGNPEKEYWLGNKNLYLLTSNLEYTLRLDARDKEGREVWGEWNNFEVEDKKEKYKLKVSEYNELSTATDLFKLHDGMKFSTFDRDHNKYHKNCAKLSKGGWWYTSDCFTINPTGAFDEKGKEFRGIKLKHWSKEDRETRTAEWLQLKIRPRKKAEDSSEILLDHSAHSD